MENSAVKALRLERQKAEKKRRDIKTKIDRLQQDDAKLMEQIDSLDEAIKVLEKQ